MLIVELTFESIYLLLTSVGLVAVSLGGALLLCRGRVQPIAFTLTSLAIVAPFIAIDAIVLGLSMMRQEVSDDVNAPYYVVSEIVRYTANAVIVCLAARLYATWSGTGYDALDARRCIALGTVVVVLAAASTLNWIWGLLTVLSQLPEAVPLSVAILQGAQHFLWSLASTAGPVFLFGLVAIQIVRRRQRERSIAALVFAGLCAAVVYALLHYGRWFVNALLQDPSLAWLAQPLIINYPQLAAIGFAGIGGPLIYAFAIDGTAFKQRLRALPSAIMNLRNRPLYAPDEDVER